MIVYTMTEEEAIREIKKDLPNVLRYEENNSKKFRRSVLKSSIFPIYKCINYLSPRKNKWLILLEARNKKSFGDDSLITLVVTYESPHGIYAILLTSINKSNRLAFYPPHFFKRYRERMGLDINGMDLIEEYFKYNPGFSISPVYNKVVENKYSVEIFATTADGISLGIISAENNFLFKTFITPDLIKGKQIDVYMKGEDIRKEMQI